MNPRVSQSTSVFMFIVNALYIGDRIDGVFYFLGIVVHGLLYGNYMICLLYYSTPGTTKYLKVNACHISSKRLIRSLTHVCLFVLIG
jgi:hypothetical protein